MADRCGCAPNSAPAPWSACRCRATAGEPRRRFLSPPERHDRGTQSERNRNRRQNPVFLACFHRPEGVSAQVPAIASLLASAQARAKEFLEHSESRRLSFIWGELKSLHHRNHLDILE